MLHCKFVCSCVNDFQVGLHLVILRFPSQESRVAKWRLIMPDSGIKYGRKNSLGIEIFVFGSEKRIQKKKDTMKFEHISVFL